MKRIRLTLSLLLTALAGLLLLATFTPLAGGASRLAATGKAVAQQAADTETAEAEDPDLPPGMAGSVDKAEYLRARADYIDMLRGRPHNLPYEPREVALREMDAQERKRDAAKPNGVLAPPPPTWMPLGPTPIPNGQTSDVSVPVSGRTISLAVHPNDPDTVYAGGAQGGLHKSTDGGATWTRLFDFQLETLAIGSIKIDPTDSNIVYIGTGENGQCADCFQGRGLYIMRNANSASPTLTGPFRQDAAMNDVFSGRAIGNIAVSTLDNNIIYVGTANGTGGNPNAGTAQIPPRGLYRCINAQSANPTFTQVPITGLGAQDRSVIDLVMDPGDPNLLIITVIGASGDGGIYTSANALANSPIFARTRVLPDGATNGRGELAINRNGSIVTVYAAVGDISTTAIGGPACTAARAGYITRSTDGGFTWSAPLPGSAGFCGGQCFYDIGIGVTQDNQTIHLGGAARGAASATCPGTEVMKRSTDGG
ncbi:MAG TPA: hypothetical protein VF511_04085, partial [Chthoniobacterales bacterium]